MAGYNYSEGMSNNAVSAYQCGKTPLSKLRTRDLKEVGLEISKAFAVWLAKEKHWKPCEWHHSGGTWYNKVDFYDPSELAASIEKGEIDVQQLMASYDVEMDRKKSSTQSEGRLVQGSYPEWGGNQTKPKIIGHIQFTGHLKDGWIHIDGGGKKKATGNHIQWYFVLTKEERAEEKRALLARQKAQKQALYDALKIFAAASKGRKLWAVNYFEYRDQFDRQYEKCPSLGKISKTEVRELLIKHILDCGHTSEHVQKTIQQLTDVTTGTGQVVRIGLHHGVVFL